MPPSLPCQRHLFDIPDTIAYLNCAYLSPMPEPVKRAGKMGVLRKARPWKMQPAHFFEESDRCRSLFARLIGAEANDIAIIPAVSYGVGVAAANLPLKSGQAILVLADQFPSNVYPWQARAQEVGGTIRIVERPEDSDWTTAILQQLDENVGIAALPQCHWTDGSMIDLERVGERCRELGTALVVDATQSLGVIPFNIGTIQPDFLITAGYKWMLGPYSMGLMYVSPKHQHGSPLEFNWITRAGSEDFNGLVNYTDELEEGATRYDVGERSNFALMPMMVAAIDLLLDWSPIRIADKLQEFNDDLAIQAEALGFTTIPKEFRSPHLLGLRFKDQLPQTLAQSLARKQVYVSVRGDAVRIAPHLYNNEADRNKLLVSLEEALTMADA